MCAPLVGRRVGVRTSRSKPEDAVDPRPRRVHDGPRAHRELLAGEPVRHLGAHDPAAVAHQPGHLAVVGHQRARAVGRLEDVQHEPGVVGEGVVEQAAAAQALRVEVRLPAENRPAPEHPVPAPPGRTGEGVVEGEAEVQQRPALGIPLVDQVEEGPQRGEMRGDPHHHLTFADRLVDHRELVGLQVAQAAVDQLRRARRRAGGEVVALHEDRREPAQRGVAGDRRSGDTAADDQDVGCRGQIGGGEPPHVWIQPFARSTARPQSP